MGKTAKRNCVHRVLEGLPLCARFAHGLAGRVLMTPCPGIIVVGIYGG